MTEVKVYSTTTCPWCDKAKAFLKQHDVKFENINVAEDAEARNYMVEKSGQMGVPVIEIIKDGESEFIVGFDVDALSNSLDLED